MPECCLLFVVWKKAKTKRKIKKKKWRRDKLTLAANWAVANSFCRVSLFSFDSFSSACIPERHSRSIFKSVSRVCLYYYDHYYFVIFEYFKRIFTLQKTSTFDGLFQNPLLKISILMKLNPLDFHLNLP